MGGIKGVIKKQKVRKLNTTKKFKKDKLGGISAGGILADL